MKLQWLILPGMRFYVKRLIGTISHMKSDIDSPYVSSKAIIGKGVKIGPLVQVSKFASIGDYTYIEDQTEIASAQIGKYCSIGENCHIGIWEHPYNYIALSPIVYKKILHLGKNAYNDVPPPCVIGNDVWIGTNAIIFGGIKIGNGAIVGAGAIVTKDVPAYAIVVGNPARVLKYRFSSLEIQKLEKIQWWNWSEEKLKRNSQLFSHNNDWHYYCDDYLR